MADPAPALSDNVFVSIHIQRDREVKGGMELEHSQVEVVMPWLAVPEPRLALQLELKVPSSGLDLVGWGREVEEKIASLQANLCDSEARIKGMYKEVSMQQQGYCLHTMMVHQGHSWAYQHYR